MEGEAAFRASGDIVAIQADSARAARPGDTAFAPRAAVQSVVNRRRLTRPGGGALRRIVGQWPGDESDDEIAEFLAAAS